MTTRLPRIPSSVGRTLDDERELVPGYSCRIRATHRQSNGTIVHLITVFAVDLQLCARAEVMKALANNREIIFLFLFTAFKYCSFINFSYYTYRLQKYFLFSFPVICDLTRRDRIFIHAKCLMLRESCTEDWYACPSWASRWASRWRTAYLRCCTRWSICFEFRNVFERYRKFDIREIQHCHVMRMWWFSIHITFIWV